MTDQQVKSDQGSSEYAVPLEAALERLSVIPDYDPGDGPKPCVHTFRTGTGMLLGAHWSLDDVRAAVGKHGIEEAGPSMSGMGHGLVIVDEAGPVFLETKREDR